MIETMRTFEDNRVREVAGALIELGMKSRTITAEEAIDAITGSTPLSFSNSEVPAFISPYKNFYFSLKTASPRGDYLELLGVLRAFIKKVRVFNGADGLTPQQLIDYVSLHKRHGIPLTYDYFAGSEAKNAIRLLTVHGAKGLEFDSVFLMGCSEPQWMRGGAIDKLSFPLNIPLTSSSESEDDKLRLFYVALTRAKTNLYLTRPTMNENGKELVRLRFLEYIPQALMSSPETPIADATASTSFEGATLETLAAPSFLHTQDETALLHDALRDYTLSVTHLNNFLDVTEGGPRKFIETNLLQFPQRPSSANAFGSAVHQALQSLYAKLKNTNSLPELDYLLEEFTHALKKQRFNADDFEHLRTKGLDHLSLYYEKRKGSFDPAHRSEFNFRSQGVIVGGAPVTGKIDKLVLDSSTHRAVVYDFKTGKPMTSWSGTNDYEKIKAWKNRNQLIFYKLLVERARDFKGTYLVDTGVLEFIQPQGDVIALLELPMGPKDAENMERLVKAVYGKILSLEFPDISCYGQSIKGIEAFCSDLLENKC